MEVTYFLEPNDLGYGRLTRMYRVLTGQLKHHPWLRIIPLTLMGIVVAALLLSNVLVVVASVLQKGF